MLKELTFTRNWELQQYEKGNRKYKQNPGEIKNTISEIKNTLEGITSRLDEAEDWISLEDKVERNTQVEQLQEKRYKKHKDSLREPQDNTKHNTQIIGIPEGEGKEQGIETLFDKIMTENFPNLERGKHHATSRSTESPNQVEPKQVYSQTYNN